MNGAVHEYWVKQQKLSRRNHVNFIFSHLYEQEYLILSSDRKLSEIESMEEWEETRQNLESSSGPILNTQLL